MRYFIDKDRKDKYDFYSEPTCFDKYTPIETLKYSIGANLYTPSTRKNLSDVILHKIKEVGAITMCLEDAICDNEVEAGENNILKNLDEIYKCCFVNQENKIEKTDLYKQLPLLFIRVRNVEQFRKFAKKLKKKHLILLCGFVFPKFNTKNGETYFRILEQLSHTHNELLYGMPIIENGEAVHLERRINELNQVKFILDKYSSYVLNIRVGATDMSSMYGLRRTVDQTIYDIRVVSNCLADIQNVFSRGNEYVVSGPVWEYFSNDPRSKELDGLRKEIELDISNGFFGKTIIHPSQINVVNEAYIVSYDDYMDAINILRSDGGVSSSENKNRMNETKPHTAWAKRILNRAKIFGVLNKMKI